MKNTAQETVANLMDSATSKEEFMRQLANLETGEITQDALKKIDGGSLKDFYDIILGFILPEQFR